MKILETRREHYPAVKLVGKRYTNADRDALGTFGAQWSQWFENDWFSCLSGGGLPAVSDDFVGVMRQSEAGFEYWIGMLKAPDDPVPRGFAAVEIPEGDLGVCLVYGREGPDLFGMEACSACHQAWAERGWIPAPGAWYMERYNCPRYTTPDPAGNVILDTCVWLAEGED